MDPISRLTNLFADAKRPIAFIDFDGTIAQNDVIDRILEEFADESWLEIEAKWLRGEIGSRECLSRQFALVKATPEELDRSVDAQEIDPGFLQLMRFFDRANIPVHIISDGFDLYIRRMLAHSGIDRGMLGRIGIWANRLIYSKENRWCTEFPYFEEICGDGCATCKPAVMKTYNPFGAQAIFIGDGLSDRFAAEAADVVFAKGNLSEFCDANDIAHIPYVGLQQVVAKLECALESIAVDTPDEQMSLIYAV